MPDIPLEEQVAAVERAAVNYRAHLERIRELTGSKNPREKRPPHELELLEGWVPALEAGAKTMRKMVEDLKRVPAP